MSTSKVKEPGNRFVVEHALPRAVSQGGPLSMTAGIREAHFMAAAKGNTIVEIFADGACSGNPGPGGYAAIMKYGEKTKEITGSDPHTTNNRMELMAVIEALRLIKRPSKIRVVTDSKYVIKGMTEWARRWIQQNWMNSQKRPVLNRPLWEALIELSRPHEIEWHWIKGHGGHLQNERCDHLARKAIRSSDGR